MTKVTQALIKTTPVVLTNLFTEGSQFCAPIPTEFSNIHLFAKALMNGDHTIQYDMTLVAKVDGISTTQFGTRKYGACIETLNREEGKLTAQIVLFTWDNNDVYLCIDYDRNTNLLTGRVRKGRTGHDCPADQIHVPSITFNLVEDF